MGTRGQVSIEYMLVLGFMFMMLVPLIVLYANTQRDTSETLIEGQARSVGVAIRDAAERVYYAGEPSQERVEVYFPDNVRAAVLLNSTIVFTITSSHNPYNLTIAGVAPLAGALKTHQGIHVVTVRAENGVVQVSDS